ncbi:hypothetical protein POM88_032241 [Heracleum sosnowskyi]|uniref:Uncharacterized protein n=1 Tax=Heracleum sosnowskyi TaxID=360622 RepID=A0AAD8I157_9APIA|nr:hypothetical protein POM88_032241 [Heracleum sosnowskyi]
MNVDDVLNFCQNYFGQDWDDTGHKNEVNEMLESTIPSSNRELEPFPLPLYEANESVETSPPELELKPLPETPTYMFLAIDENGKEKQVWVRIFGSDREFCTKLWSRFDPKSGKTVSLDQKTNIVVPHDRDGLYAIDVLDPDMVKQDNVYDYMKESNKSRKRKTDKKKARKKYEDSSEGVERDVVKKSDWMLRPKDDTEKKCKDDSDHLPEENLVDEVQVV